MTEGTTNAYLTVEEVAGLARVGVATVRRWVREGRLPAVQPGRRLLFDPAAVATTLTKSARPHAE
jgi:excisionase family DNA binding protein